MLINDNTVIPLDHTVQPYEGKSDMRLIGYVRVSTAGQADNTSTETQVERIEAYCKAYGHKLVKVFTEVASAKDTNRPVFQEAIEHLHKADGLIALRLDRVTRSTRDVLTLVEDVLKPEGKALVLLDQNLDTSTPYGMMVLTMMAAVAQLERDVIRERTQTGRRSKAEKGGYAFGAPPFGFNAVGGELVENPEEQAVLKMIKNHRRAGKGVTDICKLLNAQGYTTKRGNAWTPIKVGEALGVYKRDRRKA